MLLQDDVSERGKSRLPNPKRRSAIGFDHASQIDIANRKFANARSEHYLIEYRNHRHNEPCEISPCLRAHKEQRLIAEAGVLRAKSLSIVLFFHIDEFFRRSNSVDGHVVVASFLQHHQTPKSLVKDQIQR